MALNFAITHCTGGEGWRGGGGGGGGGGGNLELFSSAFQSTGSSFFEEELHQGGEAPLGKTQKPKSLMVNEWSTKQAAPIVVFLAYIIIHKTKVLVVFESAVDE